MTTCPEYHRWYEGVEWTFGSNLAEVNARYICSKGAQHSVHAYDDRLSFEVPNFTFTDIQAVFPVLVLQFMMLSRGFSGC